MTQSRREIQALTAVREVLTEALEAERGHAGLR